MHACIEIRKSRISVNHVTLVTGLSFLEVVLNADPSTMSASIIKGPSTEDPQAVVDVMTDPKLVMFVAKVVPGVRSADARLTLVVEGVRSPNASPSVSTTVTLPATGDGATIVVESVTTLNIGVPTIASIRGRATGLQSERELFIYL